MDASIAHETVSRIQYVADWSLHDDDVISSCVHAVLQQTTGDAAQVAPPTNYSRISVDEMDIEKLFDKTPLPVADLDSVCQGQGHSDLLSPSDYTLDVVDDDDDSTSTDHIS